jgi:hydroxymethylglutaryl-CoA synthase
LSGIYAVKNAIRFIKSDAPKSKAIVVCSDIALYQMGTSGEPTQGSGAAAILIESNPKIAEVHTNISGSASNYRLIDFRKPIHHRAKNPHKHSDSIWSYPFIMVNIQRLVTLMKLLMHWLICLKKGILI